MRIPSLKIAAAVIVMACGMMTHDNIIAGPAIKSEIIMYQPDGSSFTARLLGDESVKIYMTADGCAIGQGPDGWYYYASYDADGIKDRTEFKVGEQVPPDVKAKSRIIPYDILGARRAEYGMQKNGSGRESLLYRTKAARGIATRSGNEVTEKHGIVILAQFSDLKFKENHTRESFVALLTEQGYSQDGASGSAIDYFNDQFKGQFSFSFEVSDIVTLPHGYAYYGANDKNEQDIRPAEMIAEACRLADSQIDFSRFDDDGDGEVDNVFVFFAGGDEADGAGEDHIWSQAWYVRDGAGIDLTLDGKVINRFACTSELRRTDTGNHYVFASIGTFCHEFSHTLGLSDYYDTDYELSGGEAKAMWRSTALMDAGNFNNGGNTPPNLNAAERDELGIFEAVELTPGTHVLEPVDISGQYYKAETGNEGEYFLFECRAEKGWDEYIGGNGLLVYHIDKSGNESGFSAAYGNLSAKERWLYNEVNCNPAHQCADLVEAYPQAGDVSQVFFPYLSGSTEISSFTPITSPAFVSWNGADSPVAITDIEKDGDNIVITVVEYTGKLAVPVNVRSDIFQDAAIISWEASSDFATAGVIRWKKSSGSEEYEERTIEAYDGNRYSYVIDGLTPITPYKCEVYFTADGISGTPVSCNFTTKNKRSDNYPFIYLKYVEKNDDGTYPAGSRFPLRLWNAYDAEHVIWYMDGKEISVDASGYYIPEKSGTMKAEIFYEDGSKGIVTKIIKIK